MAIFGTIGTVRAQTPQTPVFGIAFKYIDDVMRPGSGAHTRIRGIAPGEAQKIELGEGAFAIEQAYDTKPRAEGFFESHRKYIDVQVIVEGEEVMEVVDASAITVDQPYQEERDLITYRDTTNTSHLRVAAGQATVFFPVDVHMPTLRLGTSAVLVRKTVVKVPVA
jgi:biofilm protein TabA